MAEEAFPYMAYSDIALIKHLRPSTPLHTSPLKY